MANVIMIAFFFVPIAFTFLALKRMGEVRMQMIVLRNAPVQAPLRFRRPNHGIH